MYYFCRDDLQKRDLGELDSCGFWPKAQLFVDRELRKCAFIGLNMLLGSQNGIFADKSFFVPF